MIARAGKAAGLPFLIHSHMLRHGCGYKLANDGPDTRARTDLGGVFTLAGFRLERDRIGP